MRALPVFADLFWELKPRRNEIRVEAGTEWYTRMRYSTACESVFRHGIPEGWRRCGIVRRVRRLPKPPAVVVTTGRTTGSVRDAVVSAGAAALLLKPAAPAELTGGRAVEW